MMEKVLELLLILVVIGSTLAFGGVEPLAYALMEAGVFLCLFLLLAKQTREGRIHLPLPIWPLFFVAWVLLQLVPLPHGILAVLSPHRAVDADAVLGPQNLHAWMSLTIYSQETLIALLKLLAYVGAFALAAYFFDSRKGKGVLVRGLILLGCFEAVYGIIQYLTGWQQIFTYTKRFGLEDATGTYINRNHFAGLLELTFPFVAASVFYSFQKWVRGSRRLKADSEARSAAGAQTVYYLFLLVIMMMAMLFSRSRTGILATLVTLFFLALLGQLKLRRPAWTLGVIAFLVCVFGYALWVGVGPVLARFEQVHDASSLQMEGRVLIWKDALRMIRDYPLTGIGFGTFGLGFRRYQTTLLGYFVDHTHNDYLQVAVETGLAGALLLFVPVFFLWGKMIAAFLRQSGSTRRSLLLGCIGSTTALLFHSLTDFNLQIPANALVFAVVLGIGYKVACVEERIRPGHGGGTAAEFRAPSLPLDPHIQ